MSITDKTATVMVPTKIPIVETKCNKCGKIICRRTDPHEHRDLYEDGVPLSQHSCITHPHQLNADPEIHLCEECFQMFMDEWLNPPDAVPELPPAPPVDNCCGRCENCEEPCSQVETPAPQDYCIGCNEEDDFPNWEPPSFTSTTGKLKHNCSTCLHG